MTGSPPRRWVLPSGEQIARVADLLAGQVVITPVVSAGWLSEAAGCQALLKLENMQRTGSYKIRGAMAFLGLLDPALRGRGVVAASAGNHGQAVALAARLHGTRATVVMPKGASLPKVNATRAFGAEVVLVGASVDDALATARERAQSTGAVLVPPFDHPDIVCGQASLGREILEREPRLDTIVAAVGGGGLVSGLALAALHHAERTGHRIRVVGVQAAGAAGFPASLRAGRPVTVPVTGTMADGIAVGRPGDFTFACVRDLVDEVVTVEENDLARAIVLLLSRSKQVVEPAGAAGVAALLAGAVPDAGRCAVVVSGGNIDQPVLERIVVHGLAESERHVSFRIDLPDRPGELARLAGVVAAEEANLTEVTHSRAGRGAPPGTVTVQVGVETRGHEHSEALLTSLRAAGYHPRH